MLNYLICFHNWLFIRVQLRSRGQYPAPYQVTHVLEVSILLHVKLLTISRSVSCSMSSYSRSRGQYPAPCQVTHVLEVSILLHVKLLTFSRSVSCSMSSFTFSRSVSYSMSSCLRSRGQYPAPCQVNHVIEVSILLHVKLLTFSRSVSCSMSSYLRSRGQYPAPCQAQRAPLRLLWACPCRSGAACSRASPAPTPSGGPSPASGSCSRQRGGQQVIVNRSTKITSEQVN